MPLTKEQLDPLATIPLAELRDLTNKQIAQARVGWDRGQRDTNKLEWYEQLPLGGFQFDRWKPYLEQIQAAEKNVWLADKSKDEAERRSLYLSAYITAFQSAEGIAKEAQLPPTSFTTIWQSTVTPRAEEALDFIGKGAEKYVKQPLEDAARVAFLAAAAWLLYRGLKR